MVLRERVYASGRRAWQVDYGVVEGKRVMRSFSTKEKALHALREAGGMKRRFGEMVGSLSPGEMMEMIAAKARLAECGASLVEAVEFYLKHATRLREEVTVPELVRRFREDRRNRGLSERYCAQLRVSLGSLAQWLPLRLAHEVTAVDVEAWLQANNHWQAKTANNYLGDVAAMFEWARANTRGFVRMNPTSEIERRKWRGGKIVALPVERCEELLCGAVERRQWRVLSYVVLGMLGGIRPAEVERLLWDAVHLEERTVVVMATDAKTAARRVVDLTEQAVAWLRLIPAEMREGMRVIERVGWEDEWVVFRRELGWDVGRGAKHLPKTEAVVRHGRWPHDALRHTFASMHYAQHKNEALLQVQMGHRSARMLHQHYRAVVTPGEARRFWALGPAEEA